MPEGQGKLLEGTEVGQEMKGQRKDHQSFLPCRSQDYFLDTSDLLGSVELESVSEQETAWAPKNLAVHPHGQLRHRQENLECGPAQHCQNYAMPICICVLVSNDTLRTFKSPLGFSPVCKVRVYLTCSTHKSHTREGVLGPANLRSQDLRVTQIPAVQLASRSTLAGWCTPAQPWVFLIILGRHVSQLSEKADCQN